MVRGAQRPPFTWCMVFKCEQRATFITSERLRWRRWPSNQSVKISNQTCWTWPERGAIWQAYGMPGDLPKGGWIRVLKRRIVSRCRESGRRDMACNMGRIGRAPISPTISI
jgi:hypothetical protein